VICTGPPPHSAVAHTGKVLVACGVLVFNVAYVSDVILLLSTVLLLIRGAILFADLSHDSNFCLFVCLYAAHDAAIVLINLLIT